jgi:hypothetical protein
MGENLLLVLFLCLPAGIGYALARFYRYITHRSRPASWPQILAGNVLFTLLLFALLLLAGEIYFRFWYDSTDSLMYSKVSKRWFEFYWQPNANGFRDNIDYARRPAGKRRLVFLGDSFTAGHGIKNVEDRFVNRLRRLHPELELHMLALPGYDTGDELKMLTNTLAQGYVLGDVVLVYCLNDISDLIPARHQAFGRIFAEEKTRGWFVRNSYFLDILNHRLNVRRNPFMAGYFDLVQEAYRGPLWEAQKRRLRALRDLVQAQGGRFGVIVFPFFHALGPEYQYQFVHDELTALWRDLNVPYLDLLSVYRRFTPEQITVSSYDAHPNVPAQELATPVIDQFLRSAFLLDSTTTPE